MIETQVITITVKQAECHDTCADVFTEDHHTEVNPVGYTDPQRWRVDCNTCGTCVRADLPDKEAAIKKAHRHVLLTSEEFFELRDRGWA